MLIAEIIKSECRLWYEEIYLGKVAEVVVDPQRPRVISFVVKKEVKTDNIYFIKIAEVVDFWNGNLWVRKKEAMKTALDLPIINQYFEKELLVFGRRALDKNGNTLGRITNFNFDMISGLILDFEIESGWGFWRKKRLIPGKYFVEIVNNGVVFDIENQGFKLRRVKEAELAVR